jgi:DNA-binding MarR family transcriptional regulator
MARKRAEASAAPKTTAARVRTPRTPAAAAADPPIDLDNLQDLIGYGIRRAQLAVFQSFKEAMGDLAVTTAQFSVVRVVHDNPGLNQTSLANALGVETPRMVLILDDLEARDLVVRVASTMDRRSRAIYLTDEGNRMLGLLEERTEAHNRDLIERLRGDDWEVLARMLRNLATPIEN